MPVIQSSGTEAFTSLHVVIKVKVLAWFSDCSLSVCQMLALFFLLFSSNMELALRPSSLSVPRSLGCVQFYTIDCRWLFTLGDIRWAPTRPCFYGFLPSKLPRDKPATPWINSPRFIALSGLRPRDKKKEQISSPGFITVFFSSSSFRIIFLG